MKTDLHNLRKELEDSNVNTVTETCRSGEPYVVSTQESPERRNPTFGTARDSTDEGDQTRRTEEKEEVEEGEFSKLVD